MSLVHETSALDEASAHTTGTDRPCRRCNIGPIHDTDLKKYVHEGHRRMLPPQHWMRTHPSFGEPCREAPWDLWTDEGLRDWAAQVSVLGLAYTLAYTKQVYAHLSKYTSACITPSLSVVVFLHAHTPLTPAPQSTHILFLPP